jgi:putative lysine transport system substrate-binding protein
MVGCSGSNESEEFKVGLECGYPPFNWTQATDANGAVPISGGKEFAGGYDVEIAKLLAEGMGKKLVIVKTSWDGLGPAVQSGSIDGIIAGMSPTADRKKTIDFSDPYYSSDLVIVVQKGSKYENATSLEDFAGAKITAQLNTFHYTVVDQIPNVVKQTAMDDFPAMRVALESGIIDGYVSERPEAISATTANTKFGMAAFDEGKGFKYTPDDVAIAVGLKKGNTELAEEINKVLAGLSQEQRNEIMEKAVKNQPASEQ